MNIISCISNFVCTGIYKWTLSDETWNVGIFYK